MTRNRLILRSIVSCVLALVALAGAARAAFTDVYVLRGTPSDNIYLINTVTGVETAVYTNYPGNSSATLAMRPSDGQLFYVENITNGRLYRWNPATPATAPVAIGSGIGASVPSSRRLAFAQNGTLYYMTDDNRLFSINTTTGVATFLVNITGTGTGGDMAFGPDGTFWVINNTRLYTAPIGGGAATLRGTITGITGSILGLAFDPADRMIIVTSGSPSRYYVVNTTTLAATVISGATGGTATGDLASAAMQRISGRVFEDVNYGGGAGRSLAASSGVGRPGARVELYDASGSFLTSTTTNASGDYSLAGVAGQSYTVRVVNSTVTSSRPGAVAGLLPVQTFRTNASVSGAAPTAVTDRVGGEDPTKIDAGNGSTTLAALTTASATAQSITAVAAGTVIGGVVTGVDFGFNFDTIVSTRDTGQGSLRQFITNANTLTNAGLAQVGQTAGRETSIFMISDGVAHAGLRAGITNQLTGGVAVINIASTLPALTDSATTITGATQTANVGNTNAGTLGAGGTAGVGALALPAVNRPEVQIADAGGLALGLNLQATNLTVREIAIYGFGTAPNSATSANIRIGAGTGALIEQNVIGTTASSFTDPGATRSGGDNVRVAGGTGTIQNNLIGFSAGEGVTLGAANWQLLGNEIRGNGIGNPTLGGVNLASASATVQGNLVAANQGAGIDMNGGTGSNTIVNNTISTNGAGNSVTPGVRVFGASSTIDRNISTANTGAGVMVTSAATSNVITRNSIFANGASTSQIGIDLLAAANNQSTGTAPFVTTNDSADSDAGGNGLLNFPVITSASIDSGNLVLNGFARPGAVIELFIADSDASNFGEGQTYLTTLIEGSGADTNSGTGTYTNPVNGLNQGTDTTNRFTFTIPTPGGVSTGTRLTATATLGGATSEFSGVATVITAQTISGTVYNDANRNSRIDPGETGTGLTLFVKLIDPALPPASPALAVATVTPATGAYTITGVSAGIYTLILDDNATLTDTTPTLPANWTALEGSGGRRPSVAVAAVPVSGQDFGLNQGKPVVGKVFVDTGTGAGIANNGVQDGTEAGLANITVRLTDATGATTYSTATTDGNGNFALAYPTTLTTGTQLKIVEQNATGYVSTGAVVGDTGGAYVRATDAITFTLTANSSYSNVAFGDVPATTLNTDGAQSALPGATLYYPHTFTAGTAGTVTFSAGIAPSPAIPGWSPVLYRDTNANGSYDAGEPQITAPIAVTAGQSFAVLVKEFVPLNAPLGAQDQVTLTANFTFANAPTITVTLTRRDITTVCQPQTGDLLLTKSVDKASALPGETLTYTITYTNRGTSPLTTLSIHDATPAFSTFTTASNSALPASLTGVTLTAPSVGATGAIRWNFTGPLAPGGTGTVNFTVTIDQ